jgi:hypothetical protein
MKRLITFGGAAYDSITEHVVRDAPGFGVEGIWVYDDAWLRNHPFFLQNRWLYDHCSPLAAPHRGLLWYAWKPFIILDALDHCADGDIVLYLDADSRPIADLSVVYETAARDGAMLFRASAHENYRWCTRDAVVCMGLDPELLVQKRCTHQTEDLLIKPAGCARFMAIRKGPWKPRQLLYEWLTYAINPMCTTFEPSLLGKDHPDFQEHRTEQAILTLLALKYGYTLWREADQDGIEFRGQPGQPGDFGQLFVQVHQGGPHPIDRGSRFRRVP